MWLADQEVTVHCPHCGDAIQVPVILDNVAVVPTQNSPEVMIRTTFNSEIMVDHHICSNIKQEITQNVQ